MILIVYIPCVLCPKCPQLFVEKKQLLDHRRYHVKLEVSCDICHKKLPSMVMLKLHMRDHHNPSSMFSCDECGNLYKHRILALKKGGTIQKCINVSRHYKFMLAQRENFWEKAIKSTIK